jgi:hypothetical protein
VNFYYSIFSQLSLQHGFIVCLQNACTGHFLCIEDNGTVCGTGADDDLTDFVVVTRGLGVVSFQLANDQNLWLGIYNGVLTRVSLLIYLSCGALFDIHAE